MTTEKERNFDASRSVFIQVLLGIITNFSSLAPSMGLGFSAIALPVLMHNDNPNALNQSQASWFASICSIITPVGCLLSGPISDKLGRKAALLAVNIASLMGWAVIVVAFYITEYQYPLLLVGRMITGLSVGLASMPSIVYMAEISSPGLRGTFTTWNAIAFSIGVFFIYAMGWVLKENWGHVAAIASIFPCMGLILMYIFMPESPSWLISQNRIEEAKLALCKLYGTKECSNGISSEIQTMTTSLLSFSEKKPNESTFLSNMKFLLKPNCMKPFFLISMYFLFQQCSGIYAIVFYAVDVVEHVRIVMDPYIAICIVAVTRTIAAVFVGFLSKRYGRRPLSFISGSVMGVCMVLLAGYLLLISNNILSPNVEISLSSIPLILLMIYFFASTIGFLTVPFAMAAEVFPTKIRGIATGLATCIAYIFNFIVIKAYPIMMETIEASNVFFVYGFIALAGTVFLIVFLPETKGKTLEEIQMYFGEKKLTKDSKV